MSVKIIRVSIYKSGYIQTYPSKLQDSNLERRATAGADEDHIDPLRDQNSAEERDVHSVIEIVSLPIGLSFSKT